MDLAKVKQVTLTPLPKMLENKHFKFLLTDNNNNVHLSGPERSHDIY